MAGEASSNTNVVRGTTVGGTTYYFALSEHVLAQSLVSPVNDQAPSTQAMSAALREKQDTISLSTSGTGSYVTNVTFASNKITVTKTDDVVATQLGTMTLGSSIQPIYLNAGKATACNTMVDLSSAQSILGIKTFTAANKFTAETQFTNATYAPTWNDIASGIGKSSCFTRGAFMQLLTGQIMAPNAAYSDSSRGYDSVKDQIKFQTYTASSGQPTNVTDMMTISPERLFVYGSLRVNDDYGGSYSGTDNFGGNDVDATYTSVGISLYDEDEEVGYALSYPKKSGTLATTDDLNSYVTSQSLDTKLNGYVTVATNQTVTGTKTFSAPANVSGKEQATATFKTANGGQIIFGKEATNSGTMIGLDQVAGTRRLNFRASATPGAIVWSQPESGSALYLDVAQVNFRATTSVLFSNFKSAGYLYTDANGYLKKGTLAKVATSGSYADLTGTPDMSGYVTLEGEQTIDGKKTFNGDVVMDKVQIDGNLSHTGVNAATFDSGVSSPIVETGKTASSYFQSRRFRGEGDASTYYHAVDFGYSGHNSVDFYEYGGIYNFWRNASSAATSAASDRVASLQLGKLVERGNTLTYPNKSGTLALTSDLGTAASKDVGTSSGNVPVIGTDGKLPQGILPAAAITDTFVVNSEAAMLALDAQVGDVCVRSDLSKTYILQKEPASTLADWQELLSPGCDVTSVNGKTGAVVLGASDVGAVATGSKYANEATVSGNTLTVGFGDGTSTAYKPSFTYSDVGAQKAGNYVSYTSSAATVAGTSKTVSKTTPATLYVTDGLIMGGTAAAAGLVTRGICGVSTPDAFGGCSKDNLFVNYDGDNNYSRKLVLGAGSAGTQMTGGAYTYSAVRGDQMASYVTSAISGKQNTLTAGAGINITGSTISTIGESIAIIDLTGGL